VENRPQIIDRQYIHEQIYFVSALGVAVGLPLNKIVLSISGLLMALNWLIEADFKSKFSRLKKQKTGLLLSILFFFLAATLLYSDNITFGTNDLRIKLPMLLFPIVILSSKPFERKKYGIILMSFVVTLLLVTIINFVNYHTGIYRGDSREMSLFGSHIRLSLMVTFAFFGLIYAALWQTSWRQLLYGLAALWLLFYAYKSEVLTGYFGTLVTTIFLVFWVVSNKFGKHKKSAFLIATVVSFGSVILLYNAVYPIPKESKDDFDLQAHTTLGGTYEHDTTSTILENGYYIHYFICHEELDSMVHLKTGKSIQELSDSISDFFPTLIRYMTSLGLKKDAEGFAQLSKEDLENILNGIPSVEYAAGGIQSRLARITMELQKYLEGADPNGSTIQQRIEYWRTAKDIIKLNPIFGVGAGDVQDAFNQQYMLNNSRLLPENRLHSHQQFMTIWIASGILGLLILLIFIFSSFRIAFLTNSVLLYLFSVVITFSYFFEDTLETQVGVTLVTFFFSLLLKQEQECPYFQKSNQEKL
jgi:O-antigen ligase